MRLAAPCVLSAAGTQLLDKATGWICPRASGVGLRSLGVGCEQTRLLMSITEWPTYRRPKMRQWMEEAFVELHLEVCFRA
jgi:hypothetical protein